MLALTLGGVPFMRLMHMEIIVDQEDMPRYGSQSHDEGVNHAEEQVRNEAEAQRDAIERLKERFPSFRPGGGNPPLFTLNGFGLCLTGRHSYDGESQSYVKTLAICLLFIPVLPLKAYRVIAAGGGSYYVIGKEGLSTLCKFWNAALLVLILSMWGYNSYDSYINSPEYRHGQILADAEFAAIEEKTVLAYTKYISVYDSGTSHRERAKQWLENELPPAIASSTMPVAIDVLSRCAHRAKNKRGPMRVDDVLAWTMGVVDKHPNALKEALLLTDKIKIIAETTHPIHKRNASLLMAAHKKDLNNVGIAVRVALQFEEQGDMDAARATLIAVESQLGDSEGARILGNIYAGEGNYEGSCVLLGAYCKKNLAVFHALEEQYTATYESEQKAIYSKLDSGSAPSSWYRKYDSASDTQKEQLVIKYLSEQLRKSAKIKEVEEKISKVSGIVPVALDLGIVMLHRAQSLPEAERKESLMEAEKVFLSIQGIAGETDAYRLYYGQVLFWLNRGDEGEALLTEYLAAKNNDIAALIQVGSTFRQVGLTVKARALIERAYSDAKTDEERYQAAGMMSVMALDKEDRAAWLEKCDPQTGRVQAELAQVRADEFAVKNQYAKAEKEYRKAIKIYSAEPQSQVTYNNISLIHFSLFQVTGEPKDFTDGVQLLEKAYTLAPDDSITMTNYASVLITKGLLDELSGDFDFSLMKSLPDTDLISVLCNTDAELKRKEAKYLNNSDVERSLVLAENLCTLAPKNRYGYTQRLSLYGMQRNVEALTALKRQLEDVSFDMTEYQESLTENEIDPEHVRNLKHSVNKYKNLLSEAQPGSATLRLFRYRYIEALTALVEYDEMHEQIKPALEQVRAWSLEDKSRAMDLARVDLLFCSLHASLFKDPAFKASYAKHRLQSTLRIHLQRYVEAHPDMLTQWSTDERVQEIIGLYKKDITRAPSRVGVWNWVFLKTMQDPDSQDFLRVVQRQPEKREMMEIGCVFAPLSSAVLLNKYWYMLADGKTAEAQQFLAAKKKAGALIP